MDGGMMMNTHNDAVTGPAGAETRASRVDVAALREALARVRAFKQALAEADPRSAPAEGRRDPRIGGPI